MHVGMLFLNNFKVILNSRNIMYCRLSVNPYPLAYRRVLKLRSRCQIMIHRGMCPSEPT